MSRVFVAPIIGQSAASGAQVIDGSLKIVGDNDAHLTRTLTENGTKISSTFSFWIKRGDQGAGNSPTGYESFVDAYYSDDTYTRLYLNANNLAMVTRVSDNQNNLSTNAVFRDTGWYHIVGTSSTAGHPAVYVNGVQITDYSSSDFSNTLTQNAATKSGAKIEIATQNGRTDRNFDGQISNFYFIDGQELGPEYFGFTDGLTNTWKPKDFRNESVAKEQTFTSSTITNVVTNGTAGITTLTFSDNTNFSNFSVGDVVQTTSTTYVSNSAVTDPEYAFDDSSTTEATFNGVNSWISFTVTELTVPFIIRNDSSGTPQTVAMFTDSGGSSAAGGSWGSTGTNNLSPAVSTTVKDTYTFPSTGTYYLRHTVGSDSNIFVYEIGGAVNIQSIDSGNNKIETDVGTFTGSDGTGVAGKDTTISITNFGFGTNGFYLPLDGNLSIGKDQSGKGNDFTPVNFGGSVALDNPQVSGARPILNTTQGGTQAGIGVFGSNENKIYTVTYADDGGGNKYYIDGVKQATLTGLIRGATYTFNTVALGATHPFRLSATSAHGTEYTNGVKAVTGAATTITIPHNAPDTLYYYCTAHSGMGSSITGITTNAKLADQYASYCTLALPLVGAASDVSVSVACTSASKTVSVSGDPAFSVAQNNFYNGSFYFDGSANTDYVSVADNDQLDVGSGDFTIECWAYVSGYPNTNPGLLSKRGGNGAAHWQLVLNRNGQIQFGDQATWTNYFGTSSGTTGDQIFKDNWHHIAITRTSGSVQAWYDGRKYGDAISNTTDFSTSANFSVGVGREDNYDPFQGYVSDVRVYKGVAKYTSNFVVPSTKPDILPDTPSGVANSSKLTKITSGAVRFDGSADHIIGGTSSDFSLGTGNFTIEGFIYPTNSSGTQGIMGIGNAVTPACQIFYNVSNSQKVRFNVTDGTAIESTGTAPVNAWSHFAVVREGTGSNETKVYINGKLEAQGTISTNLTETTLQIGRPNTSSGTEYFKGFISNFRVIKGTALYTSSFTPPKEPLTNVTNTKLLCCQSNISANLATVSPATFSNDGRFYSREMSFSPEVLSNVRGNDKAFTGQVPNNASSTSNNPASLTVSFSSNLTSVTSLRIFSGSNSSSAYINGASGTTVSITASNWTDLTSLATGASGTISSITVLTAGDNAQLAAVEVNGCILVDGIQGKAVLRYGSGSGGPQVTSFNPFITDVNAVRGQETEYCTINPLSNVHGVTLSDGNLKCTWPSDGDGESVTGTLAIPMGVPGKFYWELDVTAGTGGGLDFGIIRSDQTSWMDGGVSNRLYNHPEFAGLLGNSGSFRNKTGIDADVSSYLSATSNGSSQTFMVCVDALEGKMWIGKDGEWGNNNGEGNPALGLFPGTANLYNDKQYSYLPAHMGASDSGTSTTVWNFGQKPFKFAPPEGFQPLNAANIRPEVVISRPDQYVGVVTYTGAGATRTFGGLNFDDTPDLIWLKNRDRASYGDGTAAHFFCYDSVRGTGTSKMLTITTTEQEGSKSTEADLDAFVRNGFRLDAASGTDCINNSGDKFWACCWRAGGGKGGGGFFKDGVEHASAAAMNMSAGALNNYVQTSTWSSNVSGSVAGDPYQATKMFDGKYTTYTSHSSTNSSITWTQTLTNVTKLRVFVHVGSDYGTITTTGTGGLQVDIIPANYGPEWYDIPLGITGATINSIKFTRRGSGAFFDMYAVEVNDAVYVDNGVTAPNVPAIAATAASVGTKQGFSIVQYSGSNNDGDSIPHGLNEKPDFYVIKARNKTDDWRVYHSGLGNTFTPSLNSQTTSTGLNWRNVTDKGAFIQNDSAINGSYNYIAYFWHNVPGLQKFGVYKGNGEADGTFVELGFRPAVFMCRCTSSNGDWWNIFDSNRKTSNPSTPYLEYGNAARAEQTANLVDFLSNGVKFRFGTGAQLNGGSESYIYMAWAEAPSIDLFGSGANAF